MHSRSAKVLGIAVLAWLSLPACAGPDQGEEVVAQPPPTPAVPPDEEWAPPADWATMSPLAFEKMSMAELPENEVTRIRSDALAELTRALALQDATSLRAAVLLGRSRHQDAADVLLARLQERVLGPERNSDAADVVAAAALARFPDPERYWRVVRLAHGPTPHPDLEVRVECACTALYSGFDQVIPFLLQVLRIGTWDGQADQRDFDPSATTAWARTRAAVALSWRAGVPVRYQADGPLADREHEARRLERALQPVVEAAEER